MRETLLLFIIVLLSTVMYAQNKYATTTDGKRVLLKSNGTLEYVSTGQSMTSSATQVNRLSSGSSSTTSSTKTNTAPARKSTGRRYIKGSRGGCYYINSNGNKTYVDRSLCN